MKEPEQWSDLRVGHPPLIAHIIFRLDVGGLENGLVNLINHMPSSRYRHAIICLTDYTRFSRRIHRNNVPLVALNKRPGKDFAFYPRLWRAIRQIRPSIVHTRNIGTLDCVIPSMLSGVRRFIHGEHGVELSDLRGENQRYIRLRRLHAPFVRRFVTVSGELDQWLKTDVGISEKKVRKIYNGVDTNVFRPANKSRELLPYREFARPEHVVIGAVGRMEPVKGPLALIRAFVRLLQMVPNGRKKLRLVYVGDGSERQEALRILRRHGADELAWLPGVRDDVDVILRGLDIFVLPSLGEGISNTVLEAMASGLPVIATQVGGNPELIVDDVTGTLLPVDEPNEMAMAIHNYLEEPMRRQTHGIQGRARVLSHFSMDAMVGAYLQVYDEVFGRRRTGKE